MNQSSNSKHSKTSFFKYMTARTASLVLSNQILRWSSPLIFNDPFDVPRELLPNVSPQELVSAVARQHLKLIEQPPEDTSHLTLRLQELVEIVKNGLEDSSREEIVKNLKGNIEASDATDASLVALRTIWSEYLPDLRILCLTDSPSHMAMWYHYADSYSGAVFEFACDETLDSAWIEAKPVAYPDRKPGVYTQDGWAELLTLRNEFAVNKMLHTSVFTKSPDWSYEQEWRVVTVKRPTDIGHFTDYSFDPRELVTVFLGPRISDNDKIKLVEMASLYPHTKIVEVSLGMSRELEFKEIKGK